MESENEAPPLAGVRERSAEGVVLFFTCTAHALTHIYMLIYSGVLDRMRGDFGLSETDFTVYVTISTTLFGVGALPSGWLGDRWGEKNLLVAFFILSAFGGLVLGLATGPWSLAAGMAALGAGTSIFHPVGNAMIAKYIHSPGRAMGVNGLFGSLGTAAGPLVAAQAAYLLGWRSAYLLLVGPSLLLGIWLWRLHLPPPQQPRERTAARSHGSLEAHDTAHAAQAVARHSESATPARLAVLFGILLLAMTCGGFYFHMIVTVFPRHLTEQVKVQFLPPILVGGYLSGLIYAVGGLGQMLSGRLVHGCEGRGLYVAVLGAAAPLIFLVAVLSGPPLILAALPMSVAMFAAQPIENVLLARYAPHRMQGLAFGAKFVLAFGLGGLGTALAGVLRESHGTGVTLAAASAVTAFTFLLSLGAVLVYRRPNGTLQNGRPLDR